MPTVLTSSQQTFVDITDQRKLSAYITSNLPKSQIEDPNVLPHTYAPDWASTPLTLTPVVFLDQTNLALDASGLTISWKRKEGNGAEAALTSGESVSKGVLTVNANKLAAATSGMLTYLCYISYYDSETKNTVNISADITYTLIRNAQNAKLAYLSADTYVFKYDSNSSLVGAKQATLTAQVQGVTITAWQYKDSTGAWKDYPTTSDNASISGGTLVVKPEHVVFFNGVAQIKLATDDPDVYDTTSLTKIYDGSQGEPGAAGTGGLSVILAEMLRTCGIEAKAIMCIPSSEPCEECHVVVHAWSRSLNQWVMLDPTYRLILRNRDGRPMSLPMLREALANEEPLYPNSTAGRNGQPFSMEYYRAYMTKNTFRFACATDFYAGGDRFADTDQQIDETVSAADVFGAGNVGNLIDSSQAASDGGAGASSSEPAEQLKQLQESNPQHMLVPTEYKVPYRWSRSEIITTSAEDFWAAP